MQLLPSLYNDCIMRITILTYGSRGAANLGVIIQPEAGGQKAVERINRFDYNKRST